MKNAPHCIATALSLVESTQRLIIREATSESIHPLTSNQINILSEIYLTLMSIKGCLRRANVELGFEPADSVEVQYGQS
jgi:hypothetical protein